MMKGTSKRSLGRKALVALFVLALGGAVEASPPSPEKAVVTLPPRALLDGPRVTLGGIARIDCTDAALMRELDSVLIALSPLPGDTRTMTLGEVQQALALAGFAPWEIRLEGATQFELERRGRRLSERELISALEKEIAFRLGIPPEQITVRTLRPLEAPRVGFGKVDVRAELLTAPELGRPLSTQLIVVDDGVLSARIEAQVEAVRVASAVSSPGRGRRPERLVRSGQHVTLELTGPGLLISTVGRARSSGVFGDEVTVENVISGIVVRGVVKGEGRVQVSWSPIGGFEGEFHQ